MRLTCRIQVGVNVNTFNLKTAAGFLGLHPDTLRERAASGIIPGAKIGRAWRFLPEDLRAYFESKKPKPCRSTNAKTSGGSTYATAGEELDARLKPETRWSQSARTMNLLRASGERLKPGGSYRTRS